MPDMFARLRQILTRQEPSGDSGGTARKRLQLVLFQDRIGLQPSELEAMKRDLLEVVSKYLVTDADSASVEVRYFNDSVVLVSNMEVKDIVRASAPS